MPSLPCRHGARVRYSCHAFQKRGESARGWLSCFLWRTRGVPGLPRRPWAPACQQLSARRLRRRAGPAAWQMGRSRRQRRSDLRALSGAVWRHGRTQTLCRGQRRRRRHRRASRPRHLRSLLRRRGGAQRPRQRHLEHGPSRLPLPLPIRCRRTVRPPHTGAPQWSRCRSNSGCGRHLARRMILSTRGTSTSEA